MTEEEKKGKDLGNKQSAIKIAYGWSDAVGINATAVQVQVLCELIETALNDVAEEYEEVLRDKKRLARELDVAMHGEKGAAKQASLCDLIPLAEQMREELKTLRAAWGTHVMSRAIEEPVRDAIIEECVDVAIREHRYFTKTGQQAATRIIYCLRNLKTAPLPLGIAPDAR